MRAYGGLKSLGAGCNPPRLNRKFLAAVGATTPRDFYVPDFMVIDDPGCSQGHLDDFRNQSFAPVSLVIRERCATRHRRPQTLRAVRSLGPAR